MGNIRLSAELIAQAKHGRDFIIGVDLGQARDYTAIAILERFEELTGEAAKGRWLTQVRYEMPHLERPPLGTSYPAINERLKDLIAQLPAHKRLTCLFMLAKAADDDAAPQQEDGDPESVTRH